MGARFEALDELLDDGLTLPVPCKDGTVRDITVPSPCAEDGLRVERIMETATQIMAQAEAGDQQQVRAPDAEALDDAAEADLYRLALGSAYGEVFAAARSWNVFRHVAMTSVVWIVQGTEAAEAHWKGAGARPEAQAPNRETRRAAASSGGAKSTRTRASTSGTKAPVRKRAAAARG